MQVSAEAASCTAHVPDLLPSGDLLAHLYISTAHMCVQGGRAISCADDDVVAGPGTDIPADYGAGGRGVDGGSATGGKVLTSVVSGPASSGSEGCTDPVAAAAPLVVVVLLGAAASLLAAGLVDDELEELLDLELLFV